MYSYGNSGRQTTTCSPRFPFNYSMHEMHMISKIMILWLQCMLISSQSELESDTNASHKSKTYRQTLHLICTRGWHAHDSVSNSCAINICNSWYEFLIFLMRIEQLKKKTIENISNTNAFHSRNVSYRVREVARQWNLHRYTLNLHMENYR